MGGEGHGGGLVEEDALAAHVGGDLNEARRREAP